MKQKLSAVVYAKPSIKKYFLLVTVLSLLLEPVFSYGASTDELKEQLQQSESRIDLLQQSISFEQQTAEGLAEQVAALQADISHLENQISEHENKIAEFDHSLSIKEAEIAAVKQVLAGTIREFALAEQNSSVTFLLNQDNLSEALRGLEQAQMLAEKISQQYAELTAHVQNLAATRDQWELAKLELASTRLSLTIQYQTLQAAQAVAQARLGASATLLAAAERERQRVAEQLFAAAYDSAGQTITFEQAVHFAKLASERLHKSYGSTVPPTLILALVRHESNFGSFLGKGNYKTAMCTQAQKDAFISITTSLGLDPELMPVSKPAANQSCGGAMGYGQFLPQTWLGYVERVASLTGHNPPSPWNPEDAFQATALKLWSNGAANGATPAQQRQSQWEALMTYFSGSRWKNPQILPNIRFYGDNILRTKDSYDALIS